MTERLLSGRRAVDGRVVPGWVIVAPDRIVASGTGAPPRAPDEQPPGVLAPALCDLQVNGAAGHEVTGDDRALDAIEATLRAHGVTRFLATVTTTDDATAVAAVGRLARRTADPGSAVCGIHLEGPFLSPEHAGVHRVQLLRTPADGVPGYFGDPAVRLVTLAPELPGALDLVERLSARGVTVSIGHTGADARTVAEAADRGARMVTHVFNAMAPLLHRAPGPAGAALVDDRIAVGVIADGRHVDAPVLELVRRSAVGRVVLVSDALAAAGAPPGRYRIAGRAITLRADGSVRDEDGRLAGSAVLLDECLRHWLAATGATLADAVAAATTRPADAIGLDAELSPGAPGDLVELADDGTVTRVMLAGAWLDRTP
jgi:N-acetylglucosamine-6-phosphate deacetylase